MPPHLCNSSFGRTPLCSSKQQLLRADVRLCCRYHGPRPAARENAVWVCNHTSMIDYIILTAYSPFAVIMQLHPGWVSTCKPDCKFKLLPLSWQLVTCQVWSHP